jgi:endoglucanase
MRRVRELALLLVTLSTGCDAGSGGETGECVSPLTEETDEFVPASPDEVNAALGPGVNLGNMFDAPTEGGWNARYDPTFPAVVKTAGFSHVRLPVRWSNHAGLDANAELDEAFACRVDGVIYSALEQGLGVVLDVHHYRQLDGDPLDPGENPVDGDDGVVEERLVNIWRQLAKRYQKLPNRLVFELYNEPHNDLTVERWARLMPRVLAAVRETNPERAVMLGGSEWASAFALTTLDWPDDANLIATFHSYEPLSFTFQGTNFANSAMWVGTKCCDDTQRAQILSSLDTAADFGSRELVPVYFGEWGSSLAADADSRLEYSRFARHEAEARGFSWAIWSLIDLGIYDTYEGEFRPGMLEALLGD